MTIFEKSFCLFIVFGPIIIVALAVLSYILKSIKNHRMMKRNDLMEKNCKGCMHRYLGTDYLNHCHVMEEIGVCSPTKLNCYWKE